MNKSLRLTVDIEYSGELDNETMEGLVSNLQYMVSSSFANGLITEDTGAEVENCLARIDALPSSTVWLDTRSGQEDRYFRHVLPLTNAQWLVIEEFPARTMPDRNSDPVLCIGWVEKADPSGVASWLCHIKDYSIDVLTNPGDITPLLQKLNTRDNQEIFKPHEL